MGSNSWTVEMVEVAPDEPMEEAQEMVMPPRLNALKKRVHDRMKACEEVLISLQEENDCTEEDELEIDKLELALDRYSTEIKELSHKRQFRESDQAVEYTHIQMTAEDLLLAVKRKCKAKKANPQELQFSAGNNTASRLPKLEMAKFNGNHLKWYSFWDGFKSSVDSRKDLSNVDKLSYLVAYLEGEALETIQNLEKTNTNYQLAVDLLTERFGKKDIIVEAHYDALTDTTPAKNDTKECRKVLNEIEGHLRVLKSLGEDINHNALRSMIKRKFPKEMKAELWLRLKPQGYTVTNLRKVLEEIISAKEEEVRQTSNTCATQKQNFTTETLVSTEYRKETQANLNQNSNRKRQFQHQASNRFQRESFYRPSAKVPDTGGTSTTAQSSSAEADSEPTIKQQRLGNYGTNGKPRIQGCVFCKNIHFNDTCQKYTSLDERRRLLRGKCFICLNPFHQAALCDKKDTLCFHCKKPGHNRCICPERQPKGETTTTALSQSHSDTILQTAVITVSNKTHDHVIPARILFDTGSQKSYITSALADKLSLETVEESSLTVYSFGQTEPRTVDSRLVHVLLNTDVGEMIEIMAYVVPNITGVIPAFPQIKDKVSASHPYLKLADDSPSDCKTDILIGNDHYHTLVTGSRKKVADNLYVVHSKFGWILSGLAHTCEDQQELMVLTYVQGSVGGPTCHSYTLPDPPLQEDTIKDLWDLETIGIKDSLKMLDQDDIIKFFNETTTFKDNRYQVKWPWTEYPTDLPVNYGMAFGRLSGLVKRIDTNILRQYDTVLREQLSLGIIEVIKEQELPKSHAVHYLPHHCVIQDSKSTKLRIVYDASAKSKSHCSLNEHLYKGPPMLEDLVSLLLRFRTTPIGVTADIEKAFLQVGLQEEDRDVTRFLWLKDISKGVTEENVIHLRFCRVPFGIISSPYLLAAVIKHHLAKKHSLDKISGSLYIDNLVTGAESVHEGFRMYQAAVEAFQELSMNLRDWTTNSIELRQKIPRERQINETHNVSVLGLRWDTNMDILKLAVDTSIFIKPVRTKREILRIVASVFDPCGFVAPLVLPSRILLQNLWIKKYKWDTPLEDADLKEWAHCVQPLLFIKDFEIPRYYQNNTELDESDGETAKELELHCFTDASQEAYSAVIYIRSISGTSTKVNMVMSRTRLCPVKERERMTIPKLELLGVLIGARLLAFTKQALQLEIKRTFLWTDSQIVLGWMKTQKLLPPFVSRRTAEIKSYPSLQFKYVNSSKNPADIATRQQFSKLPQVWQQGPPFLRLSEKLWPSEQWQFVSGVALQDESTEPMDKEISMNTHDLDENEPEEYELEERRILEEEFETTARDAAQDPIPSSKVTTIKRLQFVHFPKEAQGQPTHLTKNLGLFKDEQGLLRCKGRLQNAILPYDQKFPILIPKDTSFTLDLIQKLHEEHKHVGVSHTLSLLRKRFWIPQGRSQVVRALKRCKICIKYGGGPYKLPPMPPLPVERVRLCRPFLYTGLDYLGPLTVLDDGVSQKRWCCIFTCMASRAIRLEIIKNLSADEFLLCLRRFVASQGAPALIVSDNAAQFKLAAEIVQSSVCTQNSIAWHFIPELAPWQGGFYERLVGLVKHCLRRSLDKSLLTDSQLLTVFKEIETVLNSRPLTTVGSELEHVLTPSDFLSACSTHPLPVPTDSDSPGVTATRANLIEGWKKGQATLNEFKNCFHEQYLTSLRERAMVSHAQPRILSRKEPKVGDIVQILDERQKTTNRANWKVGKIEAVVRSRDGAIRSAQVKLDTGTTLNRSIAHLYPLELPEDEARNTEMQHTPVVSPVPTNQIEENQMEEDSVQPQSIETDPTSSTSNSTEDTPSIPPHMADVSMNPEIHPTRPQRQSAQAARELIRHWTQSLVSLSPS